MGCHRTRSRKEGTVKFDQHIYVETVSGQYKVSQASVTPAAPGGVPLSKRRGPQTTEEVEEVRGVRHGEAVGVHSRASTINRPDVAALVRVEIELCDNYGKAHLNAGLRIILQYLLRTKTWDLRLETQRGAIFICWRTLMPTTLHALIARSRCQVSEQL